MKSSNAIIEQGPRLERIGRRRVHRAALTASGRQFYNRGVETFAAVRPGWIPAKPIGVQQYYNAGVEVAYGNTGAAHAQLGDLFNDIMGAVVPGWDQRPEALKQIKVRLDPQKVFQSVKRVLPPAQAGRVAETMRAQGVNVDYRGVSVTPETIQAAYDAGGLYAAYQAGGVSGALQVVPTWVWVAGAVGAGAVLITLSRR